MASKSYLVDLDLNKNELQNAVIQNLSSAPANPKAGQHYFNTADNTEYVWNGTAWQDALSQGRVYSEGTGIDITGSTISVDFSAVATAAQGAKADTALQSITSSDVTTALGYTPYNSSNPNGYQANIIETIKVNGSALTPSSKAVDITVPTTAADVGALPSSTKYGASFTASLNTTDYKLTMTLKDQDGNTLGTAQVVDFPIESVVVSGSYDSVNKKIVLTLQNGTTIDIPVGDLIAGLQSEITSSNKLDADLVDDSTSTNKFVTASDKTTWNGKQDAISDLATIRSGAALGATATQKLTATNPALTASGGVCTWTISNTLATADVDVTVKEVSSNDTVIASVSASASNVVIKFNSSSNIASGTYKAIIIG